jgi:hypothetical protein
VNSTTRCLNFFLLFFCYRYCVQALKARAEFGVKRHSSVQSKTSRMLIHTTSNGLYGKLPSSALGLGKMSSCLIIETLLGTDCSIVVEWFHTASLHRQGSRSGCLSETAFLVGYTWYLGFMHSNRQPRWKLALHWRDSSGRAHSERWRGRWWLRTIITTWRCRIPIFRRVFGWRQRQQ